jgi:hypothetical protein
MAGICGRGSCGSTYNLKKIPGVRPTSCDYLGVALFSGVQGLEISSLPCMMDITGRDRDMIHKRLIMLQYGESNNPVEFEKRGIARAF